MSLHPLADLGACRPHTRQVAVEFVGKFPILQTWAYDPTSHGEHGEGRALDLMVFIDQQQNIGDKGKQLGDRIHAAMWADRDRLGVEYIIWNRHIVSTRSDEQPGVLRPYTGDNPHTDHVHTTFLDKPPAYQPKPTGPAVPVATHPAGAPMRRDPFNQTTTAKTPAQKLTAGAWTRIKMSDDWVSLNRVGITPCLFAYDAALYLDGIAAGKQVQIRTYTTKAEGSQDDGIHHRTGWSPTREYVATEGRTFLGWSQVAQELDAGEYLRVEVCVFNSGATISQASSKAVYWKGA